ncbi:hydroxyacid dehydrogenase [Ktedonosporobacter rubrisoli]|uniref:Hydroxyacid dehydrogenase n=1 Tax=Ktedonosporobacter rubrisoli TaxID=2509675 RepID=A0A4P6JQ51_KTERU|nr:2-hydroxyacid dehydrogenase [Ktedonosporobacter rubrisoli]QBD77537.1 hydroxyacid dehydrogenase [Ktedonosporobacter rubrisoli]
MRLLFCSKSFSADLSWDHLARILPGHEIITCTRDAVAEHLRGVDIIIPFAAPITRALIERGSFGLIHEFAAGLDSVDVEAATEAGIWVARLPAATTGNADSVAEMALLHMLLLTRRWKETQIALAERRLYEPAGSTLMGKTACLIGMGGLGTAIARRLAALDMHLLGLRKRPEQGGPKNIPFQRVVGMDALHSVLPEADYVVLSLPATSETHHIINKEALASMKPGAFLINVGRGTLVDPQALQEALSSGHLAGAGLDVFWEEPVDPRHPIFQENVTATPHIGGITDTSFWMRARTFAANVERYVQGQTPLYAVNQPIHPRGPIA